jgi:hypothetical protein
VAALDEAFALTMAAGEGGVVWVSDDERRQVSTAERAAFFRRLLAAGLAPDRTSPRFAPPLMELIGAEIDEPLALVEALLRAGADPNIVSARRLVATCKLTPLGQAVWADDEKAVALLLSRANAASKLDALLTAIHKFHAHPDAARRIDTWLERVGDVDALGPSGFAPLHVAALTSPEMVRRVLAKARNPAIPVAFSGELPIQEAVAPEGGVIPAVAVQAGMTALDLVNLVQELVERKAKEYAPRDRPPQKKNREAALDRLRANRELLVAAGVPSAVAVPAPNAKKRHHEIVDEEILRLAAFARADVPRIRSALDLVDVMGKGPWGYLIAAAGQVKPLLPTARIEAALRKSRFLWLLFQDSENVGFRTNVTVKERDYPKEAQTALSEGHVVGAIQATLFILWFHQKGVPNPARFCVAHPESFEVVGDTIEEFVRNEVTAIVGA